LERDRIFLMFGQGLFMALITILTFVYCLYGMDQDLERARTVTFMVLIGAQLAHAFNCRNDRLSLFQIGIMTNKPLLWAVGGSTLLQVGLVLNPWTREVFKLASFNPEHWIMVFGVGSLMLVAMELWKAAFRASPGGTRARA
jgi:Ca2+-transporting ATPase